MLNSGLILLYEYLQMQIIVNLAQVFEGYCKNLRIKMSKIWVTCFLPYEAEMTKTLSWR